jgi:predicted glutamine amidotransferase
MCELFGQSASRRIAGSALPLAEFQARGGATADNPDGWGIAWRDESVLRLEREPLPGHSSERFGNIIETVHSNLLIAHVRKARWPPVNALGNTHPFVHPCCGRQWVFAHNGLVPELVTMESANPAKACQPVGETDSEFAFCHLLSHVMGCYPTPSAETPWLEVLATISELIAGHGKFNFLLSDGEHLIAYGHDRLHRLESHHGGIDFALVATEPLGSGAGWTAFEAGELRIYRAGMPVGRISTNPRRIDTGLSSPRSANNA